MQLVRFNTDRLGVLQGNRVCDVSDALSLIPSATWPPVSGDPLFVHLDAVMARATELLPAAPQFPRSQVTLHSIVTQPTKVMAAPVNYRLHQDLDVLDPQIDAGVHRQLLDGVDKPAIKFGVFLKANSSIVGEAEGVALGMPERRSDHELELAVIIGKTGRDIPRDQAMSHIAGYMFGLDMTVRGAEDRSYRKSLDTYTVLGPAFVTADEVPDPMKLTMSLWINGERRQHTSTSAMTVDIQDLIVLASRCYTLHPGDVLLTGTPEGVGPVQPGDLMRVQCDALGEMNVRIRAR